MFKRGVLITVIVAAVCGSIFAVARAIDSTAPPWQSVGSPTIQKAVELPPNTQPPLTNYDCTPATVRKFLSPTMISDCLTSSALGQVGDKGVVFNGTSESISVVPPSPFIGLQGVPNQSLTMTISSAPVIGVYLHFYRSITANLPALPQNNGGTWQYVLNSPPDFSIKDANGQLLAANPATIAFSPSGNWMIVDLPGKGMVRINMATFEIKPFAPSMQPVNDYSNLSAQLSINNAGTTVVVKPNHLAQLRIYSLANCTSQTIPLAPGAVPCPVRDYLPEVIKQVSNYRGFYQPRFVNDTQISFTSTYDFVSPLAYKAATFTMTAPGVSPTGIDYLGMGDSFASGEGAFSYLQGSDTPDNICHLSTKSYAFLFSNTFFQSGHAVSCSGAKTEDIKSDPVSYKGQTISKLIRSDRDPQYITSVLHEYIPGYLVQSEFVDSYKPEVITLSIGGNNMGFGHILGACISPISLPKACYPTHEDRLELNQKINGIFNDLVATYKSVLKPGKRVYVVGYPQIIVDGNCAANVHFETSEIEMATDLISYLNQTISHAADKAGVRYVDVSDAFVGHRMCEAPSHLVAVNGLTAGSDQGFKSVKVIGNESYHPNVLGHELLAAAIMRRTNNLKQPMPGSNAALGAPGLPGSLDSRNLPKSGRPPSNLVFSDRMTPDMLVRGEDFTLQQETALKPNSLYKIIVNGVQIGTATSRSDGVLQFTGRLPLTSDTGFQTIHVTGPNQVGQPLDATKTVYVGDTPEDSDGDGLPDATDSCRLMVHSGQDADKDTIDDACDPLIGEVPPLKLSKLQASVKLNDNIITLVKP